MESLGFTAQLLEYTLQMGATFTVTSTENCGKVVVLSQITILGDNSCSSIIRKRVKMLEENKIFVFEQNFVQEIARSEEVV